MKVPLPKLSELRKYFFREPSVPWKRIPYTDTDTDQGLERECFVSYSEKDDARPRNRCFHVSVIANIILLALLFMSWVVVDQMNWIRLRHPLDQEPYSPIEEAGIIKTVSRKFTPDLAIQGEPSEETDKAWKATMFEMDGIIGLPKSIAEKMPNESAEAWWKPGYFGYGVSVSHQLHCLNLIRKEFYPYPGHGTAAQRTMHRNHCFDYIRQGIMCSGDTAMDYFWDKEYDEIGSDGSRNHSETYLQRTMKQRSQGAVLQWDVVHKCRDLTAIREWAKKYELPPEPKEL